MLLQHNLWSVSQYCGERLHMSSICSLSVAWLSNGIYECYILKKRTWPNQGSPTQMLFTGQVHYRPHAPPPNLTKTSLETQTNSSHGCWFENMLKMWNAEAACALMDSSLFLSCELFHFIPGTGASTRYRRRLHARCITAQRRRCRGCTKAVDGQDTAPKSSGMNLYHCSFVYLLSAFQVSKFPEIAFSLNTECQTTDSSVETNERSAHVTVESDFETINRSTTIQSHRCKKCDSNPAMHQNANAGMLIQCWFLYTGSYRTLIRPSYKVAYRQVTALEWRCCPGFLGSDCSVGM